MRENPVKRTCPILCRSHLCQYFHSSLVELSGDDTKQNELTIFLVLFTLVFGKVYGFRSQINFWNQIPALLLPVLGP